MYVCIFCPSTMSYKMKAGSGLGSKNIDGAPHSLIISMVDCTSVCNVHV